MPSVAAGAPKPKPWMKKSQSPLFQLRKKLCLVVEKCRYRIRRKHTWNLFVKKDSQYWAGSAVINRDGSYDISTAERVELERLQTYQYGWSAPRPERIVSTGTGHSPGAVRTTTTLALSMGDDLDWQDEIRSLMTAMEGREESLYGFSLGRARSSRSFHDQPLNEDEHGDESKCERSPWSFHGQGMKFVKPTELTEALEQLVEKVSICGPRVLQDHR